MNKRVLFVLSHAATAVVISYVLMFLGAHLGVAVGGAALCLVFKEFGENVGKKKSAGTFRNNFKGNAAEFWDA